MVLKFEKERVPMWEGGKSAIIIYTFKKGLFVCLSVNSHPLPSKSKPKEVPATKLYGMCYPWLSCSKFNSIVQKAAVQNYESIWFQFNQLEVPIRSILRLRETASQFMRHIFLVGLKFFGFLLPNSMAKDIWESWGAVKLVYNLFKLDILNWELTRRQRERKLWQT